MEYKPRSLYSFGIAGLLSENGVVYFENIESGKHLGRITDLLAIKLKDNGINSLQLRMLLLVMIYQCLEMDKTKEALVLECGVDDGLVGLSVSFSYNSEKLKNADSLDALRLLMFIGFPKANDLIDLLEQFSNKVFVRFDKQEARIEITSLIKNPLGKLEFTGGVEWIELDLKKNNTVKISSYIELGDLDYQNLLKEENEKLIKGERSSEFEQRIKGQKAPKEDLSLVKALKEKKDQTEKRFTQEQNIKSDVQVVRGDNADVLSDEKNVISRDFEEKIPDIDWKQISDQPKQEVVESFKNRERIFKEKIGKMLNRIMDLQAVIDRQPLSQKHPDEHTQENSKNSFSGFFKKVLNLKADDEVHRNESNVNISESKSLLDNEVPPSNVEDLSVVTGHIESHANNQEFELKLKQTQNEAQEIKDELTSEKSKKWVDGLMQDLVAEKSKIKELAQKLTMSIKKKEFDFKSQEQSMLEELNRRDDQIKQKNSALDRAKEQISILTLNVERAKNATKTGNDQQHQKKLAHAKSLLDRSKDEIHSLRKKIDDLNKDLISAKQVSQKDHGVSETQEKLDRATRQIEEAKRQQTMLSEKLVEYERKNSESTKKLEEAKASLEKAVKFAGDKKKETEKLRHEIAVRDKEALKLKQEIKALQDAAKKNGEAPPAAA